MQFRLGRLSAARAWNSIQRGLKILGPPSGIAGAGPAAPTMTFAEMLGIGIQHALKTRGQRSWLVGSWPTLGTIL